jgi:hypothetical protein
MVSGQKLIFSIYYFKGKNKSSPAFDKKGGLWIPS